MENYSFISFDDIRSMDDDALNDFLNTIFYNGVENSENINEMIENFEPIFELQANYMWN